MFVMFDGRAKTGDFSRATALTIVKTLREVKRENRNHKNQDYVWFEFDEKGGKLTNPIIRPDLKG